MWKQNWFCTITYDDEHLIKKDAFEDENGVTWYDESWNGTIVGKDLTNFIKKVRNIMERDHNETGIRFMACGEYGDKNERPHYHIIFFNLNLPIHTFFEPRIINHETYWRNTIIERAWKKGISNISEATWNNIAYTARYITKKVNGKNSQSQYDDRGQDKEFMRTSRMPGIGKPYYDKYKNKIYKYDEIIIQNKNGVISCKPPKYFDDLYEAENPKKFKEIKRKRIREERIKQKIKEGTTSLTKLEQLEIEERTKAEKTQSLIRQFEKNAGV